MARDLVIIGCGGFGREVADVVDAINACATEPEWRLIGFIDDAPSDLDRDRVANLGSSVLGALADTAAFLAGTEFVVGVGSGAVRRQLADRAEDAGLVAATLIHPTARVGAQVSIAPGTVLCAGATVTTNITLGKHVHINLNSTVGHDSIIGDYVTINPLVAVSGNCHIEAYANLGTHSAVLPGLTVGQHGVAGAGACVVKDVPANTVVKGVPAR